MQQQAEAETLQQVAEQKQAEAETLRQSGDGSLFEASMQSSLQTSAEQPAQQEAVNLQQTAPEVAAETDNTKSVSLTDFGTSYLDLYFKNKNSDEFWKQAIKTSQEEEAKRAAEQAAVEAQKTAEQARQEADQKQQEAEQKKQEAEQQAQQAEEMAKGSLYNAAIYDSSPGSDIATYLVGGLETLQQAEAEDLQQAAERLQARQQAVEQRLRSIGGRFSD